MRVLVTENAGLYKTPDGKYYAPTIYCSEFFQRYLRVFDQVRFLAKTRYVDSIDKSRYLPIECKNLEVFELPWYRGLKGMLKKLPKLVVKYRKACDECDCYIFRVAQIESYMTFLLGKRRNRPIALEIVNDPSSFPGMPSIFRWLNSKMLKHMIKKSNGVSYVTQNFLQERYPSMARIEGASKYRFEEYYSSIELLEEELGNEKHYGNSLDRISISHVSNTISGNGKGHRTLIEMVSILKKDGINAAVKFVGDGDHVTELRNYAKHLGVEERVEFLGRLPERKTVLEFIASSDIFVYPTYSEGLPRCLIEAMAVGLPCLSTPVGGIPELIESKYLLSPDDSIGFAKSIERLIANPSELDIMSKKNLEVARNYTKEKLDERRKRFYSQLRRLAEV